MPRFYLNTTSNAKITDGNLKQIAELLVVFVSVLLMISLIHYSKIACDWILIPIVLGLAALVGEQYLDAGISIFGIQNSGIVRPLLYFLVSTALVFPLVGIFYTFYSRLDSLPIRFVLSAGVSLSGWIIYQFVFVAVFEELFFRGYIQQKLHEMAARIIESEKLHFWLPIVGSAVLFAAAHVVVKCDPIVFAVFFPGLLFGWLRARTGSLLASMLSHGSLNLFGIYLAMHHS